MTRTIPSAVVLLALAQACAATSTNSRVTNAPSAVGGGPSIGVTSQPVAGNELPAGTRILARMDTTLRSGSARNGQAFSATIGSPVLDSSGSAVIPAGSTIVGHVSSARSGRWVFGRTARFSLAVDGANVHGKFVPLSADVVSADVRTNRPGLLVRERATIPAGASMDIMLRQPVPVASLYPTPTGAAIGGGPMR